MRIMLDDGHAVAVAGPLAEVIARLVQLEPALAPLSAWKARVSVAGRAVKVCAEAPVHPRGQR